MGIIGQEPAGSSADHLRGGACAGTKRDRDDDDDEPGKDGKWEGKKDVRWQGVEAGADGEDEINQDLRWSGGWKHV